MTTKNPISAAELRRWALRCSTEAENLGTSQERRERLLKMRGALVVLADNEDWLNGVGTAPALNGESATEIQNAVDQMPGATFNRKAP